MFRVCIGGSSQARVRWPSRTYKLKSSAHRRVKQIHAAHDMGVATIWTLKEQG